MSTQPTNQSSIEQLHRDVADFVEEMRRPAPTALRAALLPFGIGAAMALATFIAAALIAQLI
jgi:hypothetical protein